jgi:hypothetical protein
MIDLKSLYSKQIELDEEICKKHNVSYESTRISRLIALLVEIGEFANETREFKYWSLKGSSPKEVVIEEYVDALRFFLSVGIGDNNYLKERLNGYSGKIYKIDARKISEEALGKYFPNTPMLAAIVKVSKVMTDEELLNDMKGSFKHKFAKKPEVIEGNMRALELALKLVEKVN